MVFDSFDYFQLAQFMISFASRVPNEQIGRRGVHGHRPSYGFTSPTSGPVPSVDAAADRLLTDQSEP